MDSYLSSLIHFAIEDTVKVYGTFPEPYASLSLAEYAEKVDLNRKRELERRERRKRSRPGKAANYVSPEFYINADNLEEHTRFCSYLSWLNDLGILDIDNDMGLKDTIIALNSMKEEDYRVSKTDIDLLPDEDQDKVKGVVRILKSAYASIPECYRSRSMFGLRDDEMSLRKNVELSLREAGGRLRDMRKGIKGVRSGKKDPHHVMRKNRDHFGKTILSNMDLEAEWKVMSYAVLFSQKIDELVQNTLLDFPKDASLSEIMGLVEAELGTV